MMTASDASVFAAAFNKLRRRFNLGPDDEMAADYFEYLSGALSLDETLRAMQSLWATREFFPKPADFVLAYAPVEWRKVQDCMEAWNTEGGKLRQQFLSVLSPRSLAACRALDGVGTMCEATDRVRLKERWEREYAQAVQAEALTPLPGWTERKALSSGGRRQIGSGRTP
jgi:hypothetical protein